MNPVVGLLTSIRSDISGPIGTVVVKGAHMTVSLRCVREASIGDTLLADAGVAVAVLERGSSPDSAPIMKGPSDDVSRDTR